MSFASASRSAPGKHPGNKMGLGSAIRGSTEVSKAGLHRGGAATPIAACLAGEKPWFREVTNAEGSPKPATLRFLLLPPCFPGFRAGVEEAKTAPKDRFKSLISRRKFGAGEGIRTPDPNLGKVVPSICPLLLGFVMIA
jgi:hypothetical protein